MGNKAAFFCALGLIASAAFGLGIGDQAPPLSVAQWVKGDPADPSKPDGKTVYVVEFWATWCPPCRQSIPHLSKLQAAFKDKGVVVIGVSAEDIATVTDFVGKQTEMEYRVAADEKRATYNVWMKGYEGIPHAFVVDKNGVIAWTGHPMDGLDAALDAVVAGTFNSELARKVAQKKQALQEALGKNDVEKILAAVDDLIALEPADYEHYALKLRALAFKKDPAALAQTQKQAAEAFLKAKAEGPLNNLAWALVTNEDLSLCNPDLALQCAEEAAKLTERKSSAVLDTLARVYYAIGLPDRSLAVEKEALAVAEGAEKDRMAAVVKFYEAVTNLKAKLAASEK